MTAFAKMHGLGNDFIVLEVADPAAIPSSAVLRRLADRRTGIGFDQALILQPPRQSGTDVYYRIFNFDGSEVEQCGNGARCIASRLARKLGRREIHMDCPAGRIEALVREPDLIAVDMGEPNFDPGSLPFEATREADIYPLRVGESELRIGAVSMGNPHVVIQVPAVAEAPVDTVGPAVENHARFPRRTNVGFMEVVDRDHIRLRVFERGVGETRACGTGACAAAVIGQRLGLLGQDVAVDLPGGRLHIQWRGPGTHVWMSGPAVDVYEGTLDLERFR
jgi:diaminopimelate epimerase